MKETEEKQRKSNLRLFLLTKKGYDLKGQTRGSSVFLEKVKNNCLWLEFAKFSRVNGYPNYGIDQNFNLSPYYLNYWPILYKKVVYFENLFYSV
jgi:hypothetical protein